MGRATAAQLDRFMVLCSNLGIDENEAISRYSLYAVQSLENLDRETADQIILDMQDDWNTEAPDGQS